MNIAVIGGHKCSKMTYEIAQETGRLIAVQGWVLICGGASGVMEAACRGAKEAGGLTVGILPGLSRKGANAFVDVPLPTGLGYARNILVVRAADAVIAIDGQYGTLSEIAFAFCAESSSRQTENNARQNSRKPIVGIGTWKIPGLKQVTSAQEAVSYIRNRLKGKKHKNA